MKKNRLVSMTLAVIMLFGIFAVSASADDSTAAAAAPATASTAAVSTQTFDSSVFSSGSYKMSQEGGEIAITPNSQMFGVMTENDTGVMYLTAKITVSAGYPFVLQLEGKYDGSLVNMQTLNIDTDNTAYVFKVTPTTSVDYNTLTVTEGFCISLATEDSLSLLTALAQSGFATFTLSGTARTLQGYIIVSDKNALTNLYNDYIKAGGLKQDLSIAALANSCEIYTVVNGVSTLKQNSSTPYYNGLSYIYLDDYDSLIWYYNNGYLNSYDIAYLYRTGMISLDWYNRFFNVKTTVTAPVKGIDSAGNWTVSYADGSVATIYSDGSRTVNYVDGSVKTVSKDGSYTVDYVDSDLVESYEVNADGSGVIRYTDGTSYYYEKNGFNIYTDANGNQVMTYADGRTVEDVDGGQLVTYPNGMQVLQGSDGSSVTYDEDGNLLYAQTNNLDDDHSLVIDGSGNACVFDEDGNLVAAGQYQGDGTTILQLQDGSYVQMTQDGEIQTIDDVQDDPNQTTQDPYACDYWDYSNEFVSDWEASETYTNYWNSVDYGYDVFEEDEEDEEYWRRYYASLYGYDDSDYSDDYDDWDDWY